MSMDSPFQSIGSGARQSGPDRALHLGDVRAGASAHPSGTWGTPALCWNSAQRSNEEIRGTNWFPVFL